LLAAGLSFASKQTRHRHIPIGTVGLGGDGADVVDVFVALRLALSLERVEYRLG
jgi:hypothetical protein